MKPDDRNGHKPIFERPFRVLLVAASQRRQYNCPGVDSKARTLMLRMADRLPQAWEIDVEDLGNVYARARIQSCNACVSTSMALCVWPCNCYEKHSRSEPDLMWDLDLYARLDLADAWAFIGPVNWYGPTSNLKLMFDRLVCMNGGNPDERLIDHKDPEKAMALEHAPEWRELSQNHLEGRTAGFFCYEDEGADEIGPDGRPSNLRHKSWFDPDEEPFERTRQAYAPLVWQLRYSGIEVPDALWTGSRSGVGQPYSENQAEHMMREPQIMSDFDAWTDRFAAAVETKGKVPPGRHRAFGYKPPGKLLQEAKLAWREGRMKVGLPRKGSSPAIQQKQGLNRDVTLNPKKSAIEDL
jgi:hypothetical protein